MGVAPFNGDLLVDSAARYLIIQVICMHEFFFTDVQKLINLYFITLIWELTDRSNLFNK